MFTDAFENFYSVYTAGTLGYKLKCRAKFHKTKGMSPVEYKNYLRIKRGAELLRNDDYTVSSVAETVNIPDICYFSKLFKRYMGVSPREYKSSVK